MPVCKRYAPDHDIAYDALQDTFVNVFKYIKNYKGTGNFEGWLKRIAVNCSLSYHKKKYKFSEIEDTLAMPTINPSIYSEIGVQEINRLLDQLPKGCSIVFSMYVIEGFSHKEIGESLGITESSSRSQLKRARERLLKMLKNQAQSESAHIRLASGL
jgi:RNA polymerase sigma-70 factor (ECF subfamily)